MSLSLIVVPYKIVEGKIESIEMDSKYTNSELFGSESSRNSIWGSKHLIDIGCSLLPKLRTQDLYCIGDDLIVLEKELKSIQLYILDLKIKLAITNNYLEFRVNNGLKAIEVAKKNGSEFGVYIG